MKQGYITNTEWIKLTNEEKATLESIRNHFIKKEECAERLDITLKLIDCSFEAMGRSFRNRISRSVKEYGRYPVGSDGIFIFIHDSIRSYFTAQHFIKRTSDALKQHKLFKQQRQKALKLSLDAFVNLEKTISWLSSTATTVYDDEEFNRLNEELVNMKEILDKHFERIDFGERSPSRAESFVLSICNNLSWIAKIKPRKPFTDAGCKTPLLRFVEVFFPSEGKVALSSIYEKEKRKLPIEKIGAKFIPAKLGVI